jgi:CubicO group peptidase (beta-lactamase class C family)
MMTMNRRRFVQTAVASPPFFSFLRLQSRAASPTEAPVIIPPSDEFMATLPRLMELAGLPGIGIGVIHENRLAWQHYAGVANATTNAPITAESIFPACSLGKPLFAYAALQLVEEGKLDLDTPLKEYLQEDAPTGARGERITARHVLSHSSGLVNWRWERDQLLTPSFEPGTRFQYSGEGFYHLQRCVERITGSGFEQFMQDRMMKPLGMSSSTYLWRADASTRLVAGHRCHEGNEPFYNRDFAMQLFGLIERSGMPLAAWHHEQIVEAMAKKSSPAPAPVPNEIRPNVAFSLLTTVDDYSTFLARLMTPRGEAFDLKPATRAEFMKPRSHINSALAWGLGWGLEQEVDRRYLWQWGDNNGAWKAFALVHPESRSAIVVFANGSNGLKIAERIVRAASGHEHAAFIWA